MGYLLAHEAVILIQTEHTKKQSPRMSFVLSNWKLPFIKLLPIIILFVLRA